MLFRNRKNKKITGQTALEYALVIGVIAVGVITTAKFFFGGDKDSAAGKLMNTAVQSATETMEVENN